MTRAPKIGTSSPIPDTMMMQDHSNPLLTCHSNQLLTHSLTISKKIERPRRSLRSLWGLMKNNFFDTKQIYLSHIVALFRSFASSFAATIIISSLASTENPVKLSKNEETPDSTEHVLII